jgi:curved DNA-binding protein CbpA
MDEILTDVTVKVAAYKKAAGELHPDKGGDTETFLKLQESLKVLGASA